MLCSILLLPSLWPGRLALTGLVAPPPTPRLRVTWLAVALPPKPFFSQASASRKVGVNEHPRPLHLGSPFLTFPIQRPPPSTRSSSQKGGAARLQNVNINNQLLLTRTFAFLVSPPLPSVTLHRATRAWGETACVSYSEIAGYVKGPAATTLQSLHCAAN